MPHLLWPSGDAAVTHQADPFFIALIPFLYLVFAGQLFWELRNTTDSKGKRAVVYLMLVFIGCTFSGYVTDLIDFGRAANNAIHLIQAVATGALVSRS